MDEHQEKKIAFDSILHTQKQARIISALALVLLFIVIIFFLYRDQSQEKRLAQTIEGFTKMGHEFKHDDLGWKGQKELFRKKMMKLFPIYSFVYDKKEKKALTDKQKAEYINLCFDLAKDLGHPLSRWHGPIIAIMESSFNPYALGDFITITSTDKNKKIQKKEVPTSYGIKQMKFSAAMHYYGYYLQLPNWFKKKYPITLTCEKDLLNWKTSTILFYSGLWGLYNKEFMGEHHWAISAHHFGSTVLSRFFCEGNGMLPSCFIYNNIKFPVSEYWTCFLGMKEAFEAGKLEVGKPFTRKWAKVKKEILRQEKEFIRNYNTFKDLRKQIKELKKDKENHLIKIEMLEKDIDDTYYKFVKNLGEIHSGNYKSVAVKFKESKGIIKDWMKTYIKTKSREIIIQWIIAGVIIIIISAISIYIFTIGIIDTIKKIKKKYVNKNNKSDS